MMPTIIVFCPFTRIEMVNRWFANLRSTDLVPANTNLALTVDVGGEEGQKIYARIMSNLNEMPAFGRFIITRNDDHEVPLASIPLRRKRIAEVHEQAKAAIANLDGEFVLGLEDDTVFEGLSVERLWTKARLDGVGFVTAYEAGRWHNKIIGVWNFDDVHTPRQCWTLLPDKGFEEIDAAGWYCYLTRKDYFLEAPYSTELWQPWGPDVNYGLWLRKELGLKNYVDWTQPTGHEDQGAVILPESQLFVEHFVLDENPEFPTPYPQWVGKR